MQFSSRYIHTEAADEYRPSAEIVDELETVEAESAEIDTALKHILKRVTM